MTVTCYGPWPFSCDVDDLPGTAQSHPVGSVDSSSRNAIARIGSALVATGYASLRDIDVRVIADELVLAGSVPSYFMKQLAQSVVLSTAGHAVVRNDIVVVAPVRKPGIQYEAIELRAASRRRPG